MNFLGTLIAILLALYLTGNIQDGSIIASLIQDGFFNNIFVAAAFVVVAILAVFVVVAILLYGARPRKLWEDFKSGKLKF
jgi:hypothetical protein